MNVHVPWALLVLTVSACAPSPEDAGAEALEAALEGTRSVKTRHGAGAEPPPLANAGPHRSHQTVSFTLGGQGNYRKITVERIIDRGEGGAYRIKDRRRWTDPGLPVRGYDDGRDILYDGARLFVRRLGAPWAERETVGGHPERLLNQAYGMSRVIAQAFDPFLDWGPSTDTPPALADVDVAWYEARLRADPSPPAPATGSVETDRDHETYWPRWMGATHSLASAEGKMARLGASEHWIAGRLSLEGTSTQGDVSMPFSLRFSASVEPRASARFDAPKDAKPATRPRTWLMIEDVLGDALAPVYKR